MVFLDDEKTFFLCFYSLSSDKVERVLPTNPWQPCKDFQAIGVFMAPMSLTILWRKVWKWIPLPAPHPLRVFFVEIWVGNNSLEKKNKENSSRRVGTHSYFYSKFLVDGARWGSHSHTFLHKVVFSGVFNSGCHTTSIVREWISWENLLHPCMSY
jgi:hypothetical protein